MNRADILAQASEHVTRDRNATHGSPERNFQTIADFWSAYLGHPVNACDVAAMMALLKIARIASNPRPLDHWSDLAGYAACGGELATKDQQ